MRAYLCQVRTWRHPVLSCPEAPPLSLEFELFLCNGAEEMHPVPLSWQWAARQVSYCKILIADSRIIGKLRRKTKYWGVAQQLSLFVQLSKFQQCHAYASCMACWNSEAFRELLVISHRWNRNVPWNMNIDLLPIYRIFRAFASFGGSAVPYITQARCLTCWTAIWWRGRRLLSNFSGGGRKAHQKNIKCC